RLARGMGISSLIVGLTVVALGTSSPELAISIKSVLSGQGNIAVGNVIGSNIFNVLLILGISAVIIPLTVSRQLVRLDVPLMIGITILVYLFSLDLMFSRFEGVILVAGLVIYIVFLFSQNKN